MNKTLALVASLTASSLTWACSYDGQFSNPFTQSYPGSIEVAIATQHAVLGRQLANPEALPGNQGLRRVTWWLQLIADQEPTLPEKAYIYLVDSHLWSQVTANSSIDIHVPEPTAAGQVFLMSEAALQAVVTNKLSLREAQALGVIVETTQ